MSDINSIFRRTLKKLEANSVAPTPNNYAREYCQSAYELKLNPVECRKFEEFVRRLPVSEQNMIKEKNLKTFEEVILVLLKRLDNESLEKVTELLKKSLKPSISIIIDDELEKFAIKIDNSPELIFESEIQNEIKNFIKKRVELDKKELEVKAREITTLLNNVTTYITNAIHANKNGSSGIGKIAREIESIDITVENLNSVHDKLVSATKNIKSKLDDTTNKLETDKENIVSLKEKIKKLEEKLERTKKENFTDELTKIYNRRGLDREIKKFESLYKRNQINYAVIFFDIDFFKKVNDTYGHDAGDRILSTFAKLIQNTLRDTDIVARYGGEEFVALSVLKSDDDLMQFLKRLKLVVNEHKFKYKHHKISVTFSAGVAVRDNYKNIDSTIKEADNLVYKAKNSGRNKIYFDNNSEI